MRDQVELSFMVGYPKRNPRFEHFVIEAASQQCGGCTVLKANGYWTEDGAEHKQEFEERVEREHCFYLKVSCELHKVDVVYEYIKSAIKQAVSLYHVDTTWVHVQRTEFTGMHFSTKD